MNITWNFPGSSSSTEKTHESAKLLILGLFPRPKPLRRAVPVPLTHAQRALPHDPSGGELSLANHFAHDLPQAKRAQGIRSTLPKQPKPLWPATEESADRNDQTDTHRRSGESLSQMSRWLLPSPRTPFSDAGRRSGTCSTSERIPQYRHASSLIPTDWAENLDHPHGRAAKKRDPGHIFGGNTVLYTNRSAFGSLFS